MRIFILGHAPLPSEKNIENQTAYGLRTWQFLSLLSQQKYQDAKVVLLAEDPKMHGKEMALKVFDQKISCLYLHKDKRGFLRTLKKAFSSFKPDACIGVNNLASFYLAKLNPKIPFWADLNGWVMAEAQSQAFVDKDNAYLQVLWNREKLIAKKADRFSTVSTPQKHALLGELATIGRLNWQTEGWNFVDVVPNANQLGTEKTKSSFISNVPKNAFTILFSGSYNTWLDWEMLFKGVEDAMKKDHQIYFVSTGGKGEIFEKFHKKTQQSKLKDKFIFLGWLEKKDLISCYKQVSVAINVDRDNTETKFGARNRINEWLEYEVPVISTIGTEITKELAAHNLIFGVKMGESRELTQQILTAKKSDLKKLTTEAKKYAHKEFSYQKTTKPVSTWLENPQKAPDAGKSIFTICPTKRFLRQVSFRIKKDGIFFLLKWLKRKLIK